jgi:hypothetical protein
VKPSNLLVFAGGILVVVALFLPFFLANPKAGVFGPGFSLLNGLQLNFQVLGSLKSLQLQPIIGIVTILFEPAGAVLLIAAGGLALRVGRAAYVWGLAGAVLCLIFLLWHLTLLYDLYFYPPGYVGIEPVQFLGSGYWLAIIGCVLGLLGVLLGWWGQSTPRRPIAQPQDAPSGGRALRVSPGALLVLAGALVAVVSFFLPSFVPAPGSPSQLDLLKLPTGYGIRIIWPDVLAIFLLLGCGLLALTNRKGAYLGSMVGALVGLSFLFLLQAPFLPQIGNRLINQPLGATYWLAVIGCVLGLIGALLGLQAPPAAPATADALAGPASY